MKTLSERLTLEVLQSKDSVQFILIGTSEKKLMEIAEAIHLHERLNTYVEEIEEQFKKNQQAEGKVIPSDLIIDIAKAVEIEFSNDLVAQTAAFMSIHTAAASTMKEVIGMLKHKYQLAAVSELFEFVEKALGKKDTERKSEVSGGIGESKEPV